MFRGLGYSLLEPFGRWAAIVVVGVVFGLAHGLIEALPSSSSSAAPSRGSARHGQRLPRHHPARALQRDRPHCSGFDPKLFPEGRPVRRRSFVLVLAPAAEAALPRRVAACAGTAPLRVTFRATCESAAYRWSFGDGRGPGPRCSTFSGRPFHPDAHDRPRRKLAPVVTSVALKVTAPEPTYAQRVTLRARVKPRVPVRSAVGSSPGPSRVPILGTAPGDGARLGVGRAVARRDPALDGPHDRLRARSWPLLSSPRCAPASVRRSTGRRLVDPRTAHVARVQLRSRPAELAAGGRGSSSRVHAPSLSLGSTGPGVVALEQRLRELHYALRGATASSSEDRGAVSRSRR